MSDKNEILREDFISNEFLTAKKGEQPVSSSMFDKIFLPSNRVPKSLLDDIVSSPELAEKMVLTEIPLFQTSINKPYWNSNNERAFDSLNVDIYGSVCLADDRHFLDVCVAHGSLINDAEKYTLRQVVEGLHQASEGKDLKDVAWEYIQQDLIDKPLINRGVYVHVSVKEVCQAMGYENQLKTRNRILDRLRRLSIMHLYVVPVMDGEPDHARAAKLSLVDKEFHTLLDKKKIRNGNYNSNTYTDLIINVSSYYLSSLKKDGIISRKRLKNFYPQLVGKNNIEDFYKTLDGHKRRYIHGKMLSDLIIDYIGNKMSLFGINRSTKLKQLFQQALDDRKKLRDIFNIHLEEIERPNKINKSIDYQVIHIESLSNK